MQHDVMKIINPEVVALTNLEVYELLYAAKYLTPRTPDMVNFNVTQIENNVLEFLENATLTQYQSKETIQAFCEKVGPRYGLSDEEMLQVINCSPLSPVEVYLIINDCDQRLGMQKVEQLIQEIKSTLFLTRKNPDLIPPKKRGSTGT